MAMLKLTHPRRRFSIPPKPRIPVMVKYATPSDISEWINSYIPSEYCAISHNWFILIFSLGGKIQNIEKHVIPIFSAKSSKDVHPIVMTHEHGFELRFEEVKNTMSSPDRQAFMERFDALGGPLSHKDIGLYPTIWMRNVCAVDKSNAFSDLCCDWINACRNT